MAGAQLFRVQIRMELQPGKSRDFQAGWSALASAAQAHPANIDQWLAQSSTEPDTYFIVTDWVDEPGYQDFLASAGFARNIGALRSCRASDVMHTAHIIQHLTGAATPKATSDDSEASSDSQTPQP